MYTQEPNQVEGQISMQGVIQPVVGLATTAMIMKMLMSMLSPMMLQRVTGHPLAVRAYRLRGALQAAEEAARELSLDADREAFRTPELREGLQEAAKTARGLANTLLEAQEAALQVGRIVTAAVGPAAVTPRFGPARAPVSVLDTETGVTYRSLTEAGRALAHLVGGDPRNPYVWYEVERAFPGRFKRI